MGKKTPFYDLHVAANAKIVDFAGWDMPLHYGSQLAEHHIVRQKAGMFDVSHMGVVDITGPDAAPYLRHLLANNIDRLHPGKALYTCMLNESGGILDDLIVYQLSVHDFRIVVNAGTREKDLNWFQKQIGHFNVTVTLREDLSILAIQGPKIPEVIASLLNKEATQLAETIKSLKPFTFTQSGEWFFARTGYTGEDGFEIIFPGKEAPSLWQKCLTAGIMPCGLGARDTLRLEAGLNLYGTDMDESVTPFESNLTWTVSLNPKERSFIGREALENQLTQGVTKQLVGIVLEGPGIIRNHQRVFTTESAGEITSGGYSPTLEKSIALARVAATMGSNCFIEIRNKQIPARVIKPPFVRHGKKMF